jgi:L-fucose isomerase-like protein
LRLIGSQQPQVVTRQEVPSSPLPSAETTTLTVPGTSIKVPVPKAEIVSAAAVTSVISVGATLAATSMFKHLVSAMKPVFKAAAKKVQKLRGKKVLTFGRQRLALRRSKRLHKGSLA